MPANLPPQYFEAEKGFRQADSPEAKVEALEEMLAVMPKHKGTDKLRAELRGKIAKLSRESSKGQATRRKGGIYHVPGEGAGQVAMVGHPNAGKSQLVAALTGATLEVAAYPFTTKAPQPAMMAFEDTQVQLIDMPPLTDQEARPWFAGVLRPADAILIVVDLSSGPVEQLADILAELEGLNIRPVGGQGRGERPRTPFQKRGIVLGNKSDLGGTAESADALRAACRGNLPVVAVSARDVSTLQGLRRAIFDLLGMVRVYTKAPGEKADTTNPMILPEGSTVDVAAAAVHKDLRVGLKYALIWGSGRFAGQRVKRNHVLQDRDIIELHI